MRFVGKQWLTASELSIEKRAGTHGYRRICSDMEVCLIITFSEFVQRLNSVIGSGSNTSVFARTLLDTIVVYEDEELNPIQELKSPTFKAYYNGTNNITKTARK